jgi:hypothetical protein
MSGQVLAAAEIDLEAGLRRLGYESFRTSGQGGG